MISVPLWHLLLDHELCEIGVVFSVVSVCFLTNVVCVTVCYQQVLRSWNQEAFLSSQ